MFENKKMRFAVKGFLVVWALSFLLGLAALVGIVYVAIHFLAKVW